MSLSPVELILSAQRPPFVPDRCEDGWRLEAECVWIVEGPEEQLVAAADSLPSICVERVGRSALRLRFGNAVGAFDVSGLGRLHVRSGKWGEAQFDAMLAEIVDALGALPFGAASGGGTAYERSGAGEDVLYHAFLYLLHAVTRPVPERPALLPALHAIVRDPHRRAVASFRTTPLALAAHVEPPSLVRGFANGCTRARGTAERGRLSQRLRGHLPLEVDERICRASLDTSENRFVRAFLLRADAIVHRIRARADTHASRAFARRLDGACDQVEQALSPVRRWGGWSEIGSMTRFPAESSVLQRRRGYRELLHHALRWQASTRLPVDRERARELLELKDVAALYELWCFFAIQRTVTRCLGREPAEVERPTRDDFQMDLPYDFRTAWRGGVELLYNLGFSRSRTGERRSTSLVLRPDIVLRRALEDGSTALHVLDAKFRLRRTEPSSDPDREELEGDPALSGFQPTDLHKMHAYRDALPSVRSAWVLYPGERFAFFGSSGRTAERAADVPSDPEGVGAIGLAPGDGSDDLLVLVRRLLEA